MSLKIIGVGFGRTGTLSMQHALNALGYPCYHMFEVLENKENRGHLDFWYSVATAPAGDQHNWETVFEDYEATVDFPGACVWRELVQAYPDAKVILTTHPKGADSWYYSSYETIYQSEHLWEFKLLRVVPIVKKMTDMTRKLIWERTLKNTMPDKELALLRYQEHMDEVRKVVPSEKLLEFTVDQGWEPLCKFLGEPIPSKPFPNVNDRNQIRKTVNRIRLLAYLMVAGILTLVLAALLFVYNMA